MGMLWWSETGMLLKWLPKLEVSFSPFTLKLTGLSLSNFSSLSHSFLLFFFGTELCFCQKEKYWEYRSSSFATFSLLFAASAPLWSDVAAALPSGRLREGSETDVSMWRRCNAQPDNHRHIRGTSARLSSGRSGDRVDWCPQLTRELSDPILHSHTWCLCRLSIIQITAVWSAWVENNWTEKKALAFDWTTRDTNR